MHIHSAFSSLAPAVGPLNIPKYPDIPGLFQFSGPLFHTSQWDHTVELYGKRVGIIGAGPSAIQPSTPVAERADTLIMFQQTVPYILGYENKSFSESFKVHTRSFPTQTIPRSVYANEQLFRIPLKMSR